MNENNNNPLDFLTRDDNDSAQSINNNTDANSIDNTVEQTPVEQRPHEPNRESFSDKWNSFLEFFRTNINKLHDFFFLKKKNCPYCFAPVSERDTKDNTTKIGDNVAKGNVSQNSQHQKIKSRVCKTCNNDIPADFFDINSKNIAIIGQKNAGKTNYIFSLINLLINHNTTLNKLGIHASISNKAGRDYIIQLEAILKQNSNLTNTTKSESPILLKFRNENDTSKANYVTIFDIKGEDYTKLDDLIEKHQFLRNADAFIFLIDPERIIGIRKLMNLNPKVYEAMNQKGPDEVLGDSLAQSTFNPSNYDIIQNLHDLLVLDNKIGGTTKIKQPIVFAVSKSDYLEEIFSINIPNDQDDVFEDLDDAKDEIAALTEEFKEILEENDKRFLANINSSFENFIILPLSAYGFTPKNRSNPDLLDKISPKGVTLPIVWIFDQFKIFK